MLFRSLGIGWKALHARNPRLILGSISGFGQTGPYAKRGGFDLVIQAMSGLMSVTGPKDGPPYRIPLAISDVGAGLYLTIGVLSALQARHKSGEGQWVETSLFEAALVQTYWQSAIALATGVAPKAMGSAHPLNAPYQAFETASGWIVVGGANATNWVRMLDAIGAPQLAQDPRFKDNAGRMANLEALVAELTRRFRTNTAAHWLEVLEKAGVPCGPVNDMLQALNDPQTRAREMVTTVEHATLGPVETIGLPVKFSATPGKVRNGAPLYGQHTREVLSEYGFGDAEIAALESEGAVQAASSARGKVA